MVPVLDNPCLSAAVAKNCEKYLRASVVPK